MPYIGLVYYICKKNIAMYGLVNQAIYGLIIDNFGPDIWDKVKAKAEVEQSHFLSNEKYDDSITYKLAIAASEVLELPLSDVLISFGKYWVLKTAKQSYGHLMNSGGNNFEEFIINLPNFHSRVMLLYSDITPPEFFVEKKEGKMILHYYSTRPGLTDFMLGLIHGLAEFYSTDIKVALLENRNNGHDHDVFEVAIVQ